MRRILLISAALTVLAAAVLHGGPGTPTGNTAEAAADLGVPTRVLDTRNGTGARSGRLAAGEVLELQIPSVSTSGSPVVLLNLTAAGARSGGYVSAWPCDSGGTDTSILNVTPGRAVPNMVALEYGPAGLCFSASTALHLIADLTGVVDGDLVGVDPVRLLDTRDGRRRVPAGTERRIAFAGTPGVPSGVTAGAVNVTILGASDHGYAVVQPCGADSDASTVNFRAGEVVPHFTFTALSGGALCVTTSVDAHVIVDSFAYLPSGSDLRVVTPARVLDTRTGHGGTLGALRNGQQIRVRVAGYGGVRNDAEGATVNIVAVNGRANGYVVAWPCDARRPTASTLNLWPGVLRANQATLQLSDSGELCLRATIEDASRVHLVMDVVGDVDGDVSRPAPPPTTTPPTTTVPPSGSGDFPTLPVGAALPSGAACAARVRSAPEIRPENNSYHQNRGGRAYANNRTDWGGFDRVDGDFTGTTDEIIQWAACKWGIDVDIARAQLIKESYWYMSANGDGGQSWGLGQVRDTAHASAFEFSAVNARNSTAYNVDYTYASWRACYEGVYTWLNQFERGRDYGPGDEWGCVGLWFTGRWYWGDDAYLNQPGDSVRWHLQNRTWETSQFING